jgi:hypothetical protein
MLFWKQEKKRLFRYQVLIPLPVDTPADSHVRAIKISTYLVEVGGFYGGG